MLELELLCFMYTSVRESVFQTGGLLFCFQALSTYFVLILHIKSETIILVGFCCESSACLQKLICCNAGEMGRAFSRAVPKQAVSG